MEYYSKFKTKSKVFPTNIQDKKFFSAYMKWTISIKEMINFQFF